MNRNTLIALVVALGVTVMLLLYRIRTEEAEVVVVEGEEEDDMLEQDVLEPELEVLPEGYQSDGGLPGLVRVFDGAKEIQLAGEEEYTCEAAGGGEEPLLLNIFEGAKMGTSYRHIDSEYSGNVIRIRREIDNQENDISMGDTPNDIMKSIREFTEGRMESWGADYRDFGDAKHLYGIYRMSPVYTSALVEVTNSVGTALDIGAVEDEYGNYILDISAVEAHCAIGTGHITKFYDQVGSVDFPIGDGVLRICTEGVIQRNNDDDVCGYVYSSLDVSVTIPTISNNAYAFFTSAFGRSGNGSGIYLTNSGGVDRFVQKISGPTPNWIIDVETPTFASTSYNPFNPGSQSFRYNLTYSASLSDTQATYMRFGSAVTDYNDAFGSFSFDTFRLFIGEDTRQLIEQPFLKMFGVYGLMTDLAGIEKRTQQLTAGTSYGSKTVSNYDQSGNSNVQEYQVASNQPTIKNQGNYFQKVIGQDLRVSQKVFAGQNSGPATNSSWINIDTPADEVTLAFVGSLKRSKGGVRLYAEIYFDSDRIRLLKDGDDIQWDGNYVTVTADRAFFMFILTPTRAKVFQNGQLLSDLPRNIAAISKVKKWSVIDPRQQVLPLGDFIIWPEDKSSDAQEIYQSVDEYWEIS